MSSVSSAVVRSDWVTSLGGHRIIVLGDLMLDRYLWGKAERISPEAPVPVVRVSKEESKLGGAANVALNLAALGDQPLLVGLLGDDAAGEQIRQRFAKHGFDKTGLVVADDRPTSQKFAWWPEISRWLE